MKTAIAFLLLLSGIFAADAADLRFRSGRIIAAELSTRLPEVSEADRFVLPPEHRKGTAAAVVLELAPGRMVSIYDYLLQVQGREYTAAALRIGDGDFRCRTDPVEPQGQRITLLYFIPGGIPKSGVIPLKLIPAPPPRHEVQIRFNHLEAHPFTTPSRIGKEGILK